MNKTIAEKIKEIEKGCGKQAGYYKGNPMSCGDVGLKSIYYCVSCKATLKATKETARLMIDEEIEFLEHLDMDADDDMLRERLQALTKKETK